MVNILYERYLARSAYADPNSVYWVNLFRAGWSYELVAAGIAASQESINDMLAGR